MSMKIINWDSLSLEERELNLKRPAIRNLDDQKNIIIDIFQNIKYSWEESLPIAQDATLLKIKDYGIKKESKCKLRT